MFKHTAAKVLGWGQFLLALAEQASNGHFPQNRGEWIHLFTSMVLAGAIHKAANTDGVK